MAEYKKPTKKDQKKKLLTIRERVKQSYEADYDNRVAAMEDLKFAHVPGAQWEDAVRTERGERPCYEFNKLRVTIKRVVNDIRANRPSGKVRGTEESDKETAEIYEGLIRNIWNNSDGDTIIDHSAEYQVSCGMGAWRVNTCYTDDSAFDQDIKIEGIRNPFMLYSDPSCQDPLKRDARYWILMSRMTKTAYEAKYPGKEVVDFDSETEFDDDEDWEDEDTVRIVEYWYKEPVKKTILQLQDGRVIDAAEWDKQIPVVRSREIMADKIGMCIASGDAILEEADWAGSQFPFILVYGESLVVDGRHRWFGLTRFAKDPARAYNAAQTSIIETVALSPNAKFWATPKQSEGHIPTWAEAHKKNYPFLLSNVDPAMPGFPQRMGGAEVPVALIQIAQIASEDIKNVTGIFDPSLGRQSNEVSGVAIRARQAQGEIAVFNYGDNMSKGIRRTWEVLIDLIPKIYDTERAVRILGVDGAEKFVRVNQQTGLPENPVANDLSRGKYDVTVTSGPSFSTQRQEAAEIYGQMAQGNEALQQIAGDLIFKAMDLPYSDQIAERYKLLLPPQIQQAESEGKPMPPEVMQIMERAQQAMQMVQEQGSIIQKEAAQVEQGKADLTRQISQLNVMQANMEADFTKLSADLTKREAAFILKQAQASTDEGGVAVAQDRDALSTQVQQALVALEQRAAEFMANAAQVITNMQMQAQPQVVVADPPKNKIVRVKRVNGELIGTIEEAA